MFLKINLPEPNLKKGDVTTLIDFVPQSAIKPLAENEILTTILLEI